ncbi:hypothetical protein ACOL3I_00745 [Aliarcobacter butzleri]
MNIKFLKAKHFWENSENAKWEKSSNFDNEIFKKIQNEYEYLCSKKIKYKTINKKNVFFFYEEKKDKFGRKIIELVALVSSKNISNCEKIYKEISQQLNVFDNNLDVSIQTNERISKRFIYIFVSIVILLIGINFLIMKDKTVKQDTKNIEVVTKTYSYKNFKENWNRYIYEEEIDNKYLLKEDDKEYIYSELEKYLKFNPYLEELSKIKDLSNAYLIPVKDWIESRNKINYVKFEDNLKEEDLYKSIVKILNTEHFSKNTVINIIELNDFCFFYEENKNKFFNNGLDKKTKCNDIKTKLNENNININLER